MRCYKTEPPPEGRPVEDFNPTPWTPAQIAALDRAYQDLVRDYPNHYIAYLDEWHGEELTRTVVVAAPTAGEYMAKMQELPADYCRTLGVTRVSSPDSPIFCSRLLFRDIT